MPVNRLYQVVGRTKPTAKNPAPQIFRMKLFAHNKPVAMSRFWYFLAMLHKSKASTGEILEIKEIFEKKTSAVKIFGLNIRFNSRSGTHNMYKEYRDVSLNGAIDKMYAELASRHRCRRSSIWIVDTAVVKAKDAKREAVQQMLNPKIAFQVNHRVPRAESKAFRTVFRATKPCTFF